MASVVIVALIFGNALALVTASNLDCHECTIKLSGERSADEFNIVSSTFSHFNFARSTSPVTFRIRGEQVLN